MQNEVRAVRSRVGSYIDKAHTSNRSSLFLIGIFLVLSLLPSISLCTDAKESLPQDSTYLYSSEVQIVYLESFDPFLAYKEIWVQVDGRELRLEPDEDSPNVREILSQLGRGDRITIRSGQPLTKLNNGERVLLFDTLAPASKEEEGAHALIEKVVHKNPSTPNTSEGFPSGDGSPVQAAGLDEPALVPESQQSVLGLIVAFAGTPPAVTSDEVIASIWTDPLSVRNTYLERTHGQIEFINADHDGDGQYDVFGPYVVGHPDPDANCPAVRSAIKQQLLAQIAEQGLDVTQWDHVVGFLPDLPVCFWGGVNGGLWTWMNGTVHSNLLAHELGHGMNLHHATWDADNDGDIFGWACNDWSCEASDVMGIGNYVLSNAPNKISLGVMYQGREELSGTDYYRLSPLSIEPSEAEHTQIWELGVPDDPYGRGRYYLSYRIPHGLDANLDPLYTHKVSIHRGRGTTKMIDTVGDGESFYDPVEGIGVYQLEHTDEYSESYISLNNDCAPVTPQAFYSVIHEVSGPGEWVNYTVKVVNKDREEICDQPTEFSLSGSSEHGLQVQVVQPSITLAPGEEGFVDVQVASSIGVMPGWWKFRLHLVDNDGIDPPHVEKVSIGTLKVTGTCNDNMCEWTEEENCSTCPSDCGICSPPSGIEAEELETVPGILVTWDSSDYVEEYYLYRSELSPFVGMQPIGDPILGVHSAYYDSEPLAPGTTYYYRIAAKYIGGEVTDLSDEYGEVTTCSGDPTQACSGSDVHWFDSCGNVGEMAASCGGSTPYCQDANCVECSGNLHCSDQQHCRIDLNECCESETYLACQGGLDGELWAVSSCTNGDHPFAPIAPGCTQNQVCYGGGCVASCDDSLDGGDNPFEVGSVLGRSQVNLDEMISATDYCDPDTGSLIEHSCSGDGFVQTSSVTCESLGINYQCVDGACFSECVIYSASWLTFIGSAGEGAILSVIGSPGCAGETVTFEIFNDVSPAQSHPASTAPQAVVLELQNGFASAHSTWSIEVPTNASGYRGFYAHVQIPAVPNVSFNTLNSLVVREPVCGNGIQEALEGGEECDDGNLVSEDGCSASCVTEYCGDGIIQRGLGEECEGATPARSTEIPGCRSCRIIHIHSFLPGTLITLADGGIQPIESISEGDLVLSYDQKTQELRGAPVVATFHHDSEGHYVINERLRITATNPIWVNGEWRLPGQIKLGDELFHQSEQEERVFAIRYVSTEKGVKVYNLAVKGTRTYFADGLLVHNKTTIGGPGGFGDAGSDG